MMVSDVHDQFQDICIRLYTSLSNYVENIFNNHKSVDLNSVKFS